jgi:hypothetical protein
MLNACAASGPVPKTERVAVPAMTTGLNGMILRAIQTMPLDGGYSASNVATRALGDAIVATPQTVAIDATRAMPSYCSGATYLVFLRVCQELIQEGKLTLDPATLQALRVTGQRDGEGIWGRWNANGPGTARLFFELGLGKNFTEWEQALPGDFMKIFWTTEIGQRERGHSVIFLGTETEAGVDYVRFWSSNQGRGYSEKRVERKKVPFAIFSRLEHPANISGLRAVQARDAWLGDLLVARSSQGEVRAKCGM